MVRRFRRYLTTIPENKRCVRDLFYDVKDIVGSSGFGIGSAGLPAYNLLLEGYNQALENDVVLSMKQANVPALSRVIDIAEAQEYFEHEGHRTTISQRSLQVHSDPFLGYTTLRGSATSVDELSPYETDLVWDDINEPEEMEACSATSAGRRRRSTAPPTRTATSRWCGSRPSTRSSTR